MTCGTNWVKSMILPNFIKVLKVFEVTQGFTEYCTVFHRVIFQLVVIKELLFYHYKNTFSFVKLCVNTS